jgi:FAD dependent oxidoreductase
MTSRTSAHLTSQSDDGFKTLTQVRGLDGDGWARFEGIESWIRALLPKLGKVTHRWSGQTLDPVDYAAFIGRNPGNDHVFVHTGDSGQGLTHGVAGSLLLSQLIAGETCPWVEFYDPSRITLSRGEDFHRRKYHRGEKFCRIYCTRRTEIRRRIETGKGRDRPRGTAQGCGFPG